MPDTRWDTDTARDAANKRWAMRDAAIASGAAHGAGRDGLADSQGVPILELAKAKAIKALRDTEDPRTIAGLIAGISRLSPPPRDAGVSEADDELVRRYRAAGFELPYS